MGREEGEVGGVEVGGVSLEGLVEITVFIWKLKLIRYAQSLKSIVNK